MPPSDPSTQNTPLAPSVEKAYYRKCIALKRRLNEIEAANDEARVRRVRLDRAILKMRLERALLLDELRRRMEHSVDDSDGSGEEIMATPPPDRPHRDKRRRQQGSNEKSTAASPPSNNAYTSQSKRSATTNSRVAEPKEKTGKDRKTDGEATSKENKRSELGQPRLENTDSAANGIADEASKASHGGDKRNGEDRNTKPINRETGATGEPLTSGPTVSKDTNGDRRVEVPEVTMKETEPPS